ncbi:MAG TPA: MBL fold metallo-hydrolase [Polyangiaceae bacterium]
MGHGDSIVVEVNDEERRVIVVDCNVVRYGGVKRNRTVELLEQLKIKTIDLAVVTHFHRDHCSGFNDIFKNFDVRRLMVPPFLSENQKLFKALRRQVADRLRRSVALTDDGDINDAALGLASVLKFIATQQSRVEEGSGKNGVIGVQGAGQLEIRTHLPLKAMKAILQGLMRGDSDLDTLADVNDSSVVLSLEYRGHTVVLGADSTLGQWTEHRRQMERDGVLSLNADALKVPHHASKHNSNESIYKYLLGDDTAGKFVFVSANGKSHPHDEFFDLVVRLGLQPRCTNLASQCFGANVVRWVPMKDIPPEAAAFITHYPIESAPIQCQGDIVLEIDDNGRTQVSNSTGRGCVYDTQLMQLGAGA